MKNTRLFVLSDVVESYLGYEICNMHRHIRDRPRAEFSASLSICNEANLTGSENVGGSTAAPAAPEAASDDDGGDPDPEPERRPRTCKTRNASPTGNLPAPTTAHIPDALAQFDTLPASSFVRLPVVCGLFACSPATAWRWVKAGKIPAPVKLSDRVTAWRVGDLRAALSALAA